jgi:hypothetical protein
MLSASYLYVKHHGPAGVELRVSGDAGDVVLTLDSKATVELIADLAAAKLNRADYNPAAIAALTAD